MKAGTRSDITADFRNRANPSPPKRREQPYKLPEEKENEDLKPVGGRRKQMITATIPLSANHDEIYKGALTWGAGWWKAKDRLTNKKK